VFPSLKPQVKTGHFTFPALIWLAGLLCVAPALPQLTAADYTQAERTRFEDAFHLAEQARLQGTNTVELSWRFARAAFDWADAQTRDRDRARLAQAGIDACNSALSLDANCAQAHYFLALNLGQLAQTKTLGALRIVTRIEAAFLAALAADPSVDNAGPDRGLGLLYLEAPGWPTSIGDRTKARRHLERCVELAPTHPGNRLALAEALLEWRDREGARAQLDAIDRDWPSNRLRLATPDLEADWRVWLQRRNAIAGRLKRPPISLDPPSTNSLPSQPLAL
jgi:hypothetical protein